jgi:hypothetical protein
MIEPKNETRFLSWLADKYTKQVGYGVRNIDTCPFLTMYSIEHLPEWLYSVSNNVTKVHIIHWAKELEVKGLLRFSNDRSEFFFTKLGYELAQRNWFQKLAVWLNNNPGAISAVAFLVSLGSLIVAVIALNNE